MATTNGKIIRGGLTRYERAKLATYATTYLKARPGFSFKGNRLWLTWVGCNMKTGEPIMRECPVIISDCDFFVQHDRHPWGGNQGQALAIIARWVRDARMPLDLENWERWCGPPVSLGNSGFLAAIKEHIYQIKTPSMYADMNTDQGALAND